MTSRQKRVPHERVHPAPKPPLIVVDTLVVIGAIIGIPNSASHALMNAIETGEAHLAVSDDWLRELVRVLEYPRIAEQIGLEADRPARAFRIALGIGLIGSFHHPKKLDWPSLSDPNDGWIFDLAFQSLADFIVSRDKRVMAAGLALDFEVLEPKAALERVKIQNDS